MALTLLDRLPELRDDLEAAADPDRAKQMAAYLRDQFAVFGVATPERRSIQKPLLVASAASSQAELLDFAEACWAEDEREFQYVAVDVLRKRAGTLELDDLSRVRGLIVERSWWDTVDPLAIHVVGALVRANAELSRSMDEWIVDPHLWVARTAMLHQLMWKADTDPERLARYVRLQAGHPDFFMRKAIGWALRQYARTDPDAVRSLVGELDGALSGLSKREALKHL